MKTKNLFKLFKEFWCTSWLLPSCVPPVGRSALLDIYHLAYHRWVTAHQMSLVIKKTKFYALKKLKNCVWLHPCCDGWKKKMLNIGEEKDDNKGEINLKMRNVPGQFFSFSAGRNIGKHLGPNHPKKLKEWKRAWRNIKLKKSFKSCQRRKNG